MRLKRETIKIAESVSVLVRTIACWGKGLCFWQALVKIEDSIQHLADGFVKHYDDEEFRTGYLAVLHDL